MDQQDDTQKEISEFDNNEVDNKNPQCPNKPKIPYQAKKSFVPQFEDASYLKKQEQINEKKKNLSGGYSGEKQIKQHQCCDKFTKITEQNQKHLEQEIITIQELNITLIDHSFLLQKSIQMKQQEAEKQKETFESQFDISKQLSDKEQQILNYKQKWEQERKNNLQRDQKIKELQSKLKKLQEKSTTLTVSVELQDEVNAWKNKFIQLNRNYKEAQQKLTLLENEVDMLKQNQPKSLRSSELRQSTTTTRRRTVKINNGEEQQQ